MKYFPVISYITLTLATVVMLLSGFWLLWPVSVITISNPTAVELDKTIYNPGDRVTYTLTYCKYKQVEGTVYRTLVNSIRLNYTSLVSHLPMGCSTIKNRDLTIPEFVDKGVYHLETTAIYQVNPLRKVTIFWRSIDFEIQ